MIFLQPYSGIGDSVYQRPFIRALSEREKEIYLQTPWPELYNDLPNIKFVEPKADYRTQAKNIRRIDRSIWHPAPNIAPKLITKIGYSGEDLLKGNIIQAYERQIPLENTPFKFDMPDWVHTEPLPEINNEGRPIAIIRPVTLRKEWIASARTPAPQYIFDLSKDLIQSGYHVISIADTEPDVEWIVPPEPLANQKFIKGELDIKKLFALCAKADLIVGGVGWIVPAGIALNTPTFIVFGGCGFYNQVSKLTDLRMDLRNFGYAVPDKFCRCTESVHNCPKYISDLNERFYDFVIRTKGQRNHDRVST